MKLLVIVLCLLSERFLTHKLAKQRFNWFPAFFAAVANYLPAKMQAAPLVLIAVLLPPILLLALSLLLLDSLFWGLVGLLVHLALFYYCLGPQNPFYPLRTNPAAANAKNEVAAYLARVNTELFAPIFYYLIGGPLFLLGYRLLTLCRLERSTQLLSERLLALLEWLPARITAILYLLVGNFQPGFTHLAKNFFSAPKHNESLLSETGILVASSKAKEEIHLSYAEHLVVHAISLLLVILALFTFFAWL